MEPMLNGTASTCIKNLEVEWLSCPGCGQLEANEASWWRITIVLIISLLAVPTNLVVIVVVHQTPALHNNQCIYMVALAISDLSAGLCFLATSFRYAVTGYGPSTRAELDIGAWMYYLALTTGLLLTVSIGLDKLHQINWPYSYDRVMTKRKVVGIVTGIWVGIAVLSGLPTRLVPISGYYYEFTSSTLMFNTKSCRGENQSDGSLVIVRIALFLFLVIVLFGGYGTILVITRRHVRRMRGLQQYSVPLAPQSTNGTAGDSNTAAAAATVGQTGRLSNRANLRGWITNACIILGFLACWMPFFIYKIVIARTNSQTESAQFCIAWFAIIYTSLNALIYGGTYKPFKTGLARYVNRLRNNERERQLDRRTCGPRYSTTANRSNI